MKVRMLTGLVGTTEAGEPLALEPGEVVDLPAGFAQALVAGDEPRAEVIAETRAQTRERATRGPRSTRA